VHDRIGAGARVTTVHTLRIDGTEVAASEGQTILDVAVENDIGNVDHYDGLLRVMDADGNLLADRFDPTTYTDYLGEAVEPWTYLKSTYWKKFGYPDGIYRRATRRGDRGRPDGHTARRHRTRRVPEPARTRSH
jgi:coenzyme F420-reducing hydrogenase alpha subunit